MDSKITAVAVSELVECISPYLTRKDPVVVSAALADLVATWLAGLVANGDPESAESWDYRNQMLGEWHKCCKDLIPVNVAMLKEQGAYDDPDLRTKL